MGPEIYAIVYYVRVKHKGVRIGNSCPHGFGGKKANSFFEQHYVSSNKLRYENIPTRIPVAFTSYEM